MPGGDLMDVLVAEAKVIKRRVPQGGWQVWARMCQNRGFVDLERLANGLICDTVSPLH